MTVAAATPSISAFPSGIDNTQRHLVVYGTVAIGASPLTYATGGVAMSFTGLEPLKTSNLTPLWCDVRSVSGSGYVYIYNASSGKLQIFTGAAAQSPLTELSAGAVPAAVSGDTINFKAEFLKNI